MQISRELISKSKMIPHRQDGEIINKYPYDAQQLNVSGSNCPQVAETNTRGITKYWSQALLSVYISFQEKPFVHYSFSELYCNILMTQIMSERQCVWCRV